MYGISPLCLRPNTHSHTHTHTHTERGGVASEDGDDSLPLTDKQVKQTLSRSPKHQKGAPKLSKKRQQKDMKYGYGGPKRHVKGKVVSE